MLGTAAVQEHNGCVTVVVDKITSVCPSPICLVDGTSEAVQIHWWLVVQFLEGKQAQPTLVVIGARGDFCSS